MNDERPVKPHARTMEELLDDFQSVVQMCGDCETAAESMAVTAHRHRVLHQVAYLVDRLHYECMAIEADAGQVLRDWDRPEDHEVAHAKCEVTTMVRRILWDFENTVTGDERCD